MKRLIITSAAALLLVLAAALPAAAADHARPFHGSWTSADEYDFAAPGCPAGTFLRFSTTGTAEFTHLGLTRVQITHCTHVDMAAFTGGWETSVITLVAANGDRLVLSDEGTFTLTPNPSGPPPASRAVNTTAWHVTSGTGRFAHADGQGTGWSDDNMLTGMQEFHMTGWISY